LAGSGSSSPAVELICVVTAGHYDNAAMEWLPLLIFNR
jgi:hypothetical protein